MHVPGDIYISLQWIVEVFVASSGQFILQKGGQAYRECVLHKLHCAPGSCAGTLGCYLESLLDLTIVVLDFPCIMVVYKHCLYGPGEASMLRACAACLEAAVMC